MTELERRAWPTAGRAIGNITNNAVAALLTLHYGFDPQSAAVHGAVVGSIGEELISLAASWRLKNLDRFARTVEDESDGLTFDEVVSGVMDDERKLGLLLVASEAASRAGDEWKIDLLARTFVHGVGNDDKVDAANLILDVVRQLEPMHLELLRRFGGFAVIRPHSPVHSVLTTEHLRSHAHDSALGDPPLTDLSQVIHTLLAKLESLGIIDNVQEHDPWSENPMGDQQAPIRTKPKLGWALTEFGEQVASFLRSRRDVGGGSDAADDRR
ncbi:hypothetical protein ACFFX1_41390 [Dactylosporangium sucinum]|uniref:Uncharacterized protein n=1 Tax=Dactylosporangium sucinum TaxID=1424081 RepID=A0A917X7I2_9ACTN|nr:hypothetical protein [Dactylosporangium sucinum]GGM90338.1 hypothetical protein GCM10007977_110440 [Dactylosporangium sucinum]